jgi:hypothetical protein
MWRYYYRDGVVCALTGNVERKGMDVSPIVFLENNKILKFGFCRSLCFPPIRGYKVGLKHRVTNFLCHFKWFFHPKNIKLYKSSYTEANEMQTTTDNPPNNSANGLSDDK